jgi:hypothetical protein
MHSLLPRWVKSTHYRSAAALLSASPQSTDISARGDPAGAFGRLARRERLDSSQCTAPTRALGTIDEGVG